jgi:hypothetical protein
MSWRGQGGRRAKGRRGDQDPETDNTAWLAELEREATQADDEEDDWADTLRGRRPATPAAAPPPASAPPSPPPAPEPDWMPAADPSPPPPPDYRLLGMEPDGTGSSAWDPTTTSPDPPPAPDWSWRPQAPEAFEEPRQAAQPDPGTEGFDPPRQAGQPDLGHRGFGEPPPARPQAEWEASRDDPGEGWQAAGGMETPTGAWSPADPAGGEPDYLADRFPDVPVGRQPDPPVGREPDYPALFGELYRRSAAQQDPIWEAPPAAEPLPEPGQTDPPAAAWPFEETTQSWEPSDRSFVWPSDELPSTPTEWDPSGAPSWMDDPPPQRADPEQTAAWAAPEPDAQPSGWSSSGSSTPTSAWAAPPTPGNGVPPPVAPPPADWAAAIPTDVPAARRVADPSAATRSWRPDRAVDAEPAVPLGAEAHQPGTAPAAAEQAAARRPAAPKSRRVSQPDERQARAWPRIVAVISWIVLVMVVCWFYVFPWLERVLPESF